MLPCQPPISYEMMLEDVTTDKSHNLKTREIFFIDDDQEELGIFTMAMKDINTPINIKYAKSGDDLFKLLEQSLPDLLFLDLHLPGRSGITCLKMLRYDKKYDAIPIIIYSKLSTDFLVNDCYRAKANYYLVKPVSVGKLKAAIKKIIDTNWDSKQSASFENFIIR